jgi:hypothetical protein
MYMFRVLVCLTIAMGIGLGSVSAQAGDHKGAIFDANEVVEPTAMADTGPHFVTWTSDASGDTDFMLSGWVTTNVRNHIPLARWISLFVSDDVRSRDALRDYIQVAMMGGCETPEDCDDDNACTIDACVDTVCEYTFAPDTTVCRSAAGACDVEEYCTGTSTDCPADAYEPEGTPCPDGLFCTGDNTCDGAGTCLDGEDPCAPEKVCDEDDDVCVHFCATLPDQPVCFGDVNGDGWVDSVDYGLVLAAYDDFTPENWCRYDVNCDVIHIDSVDLGLIEAAFGECRPDSGHPCWMDE